MRISVAATITIVSSIRKRQIRNPMSIGVISFVWISSLSDSIGDKGRQNAGPRPLIDDAAYALPARLTEPSVISRKGDIYFRRTLNN